MSGLSDFIKEGTLNHIYCADLVDTALDRPSAMYLACHSSDPTNAGLVLTEYLGGSYVRQPITFNEATTDDDSGDSYVTNREAISFTDMPNATITHFAIWDALTEGNMLSSGGVIAVNGSAVTTIPTGSGDTLTIAADILRVYL